MARGQLTLTHTLCNKPSNRADTHMKESFVGVTRLGNARICIAVEVVYSTHWVLLQVPLLTTGTRTHTSHCSSVCSHSGLTQLPSTRSSLSRDEGPRDGQGAGVLRRGVLYRSQAHLHLRRLPMRTIKRRRQPVVALLVGAVAFREVIVGVGGVDAHDWNRLWSTHNVSTG